MALKVNEWTEFARIGLGICAVRAGATSRTAEASVRPALSHTTLSVEASCVIKGLASAAETIRVQRKNG